MSELRPELLVATSVVNPNVQTRLLVTGSEPLTMGIEQKRLVYATVLGRSALQADNVGPSITIVERTFAVTKVTNVSDRFVNNWLACNQAGIPVPPTMRRVDKNRLLITDVKADGSETYGKAMTFSFGSAPEDERCRAHTNIDPLFMDVTSDMGPLEAKLDHYVARATTAGIKLANDDPFELVVRPDGTWDFMALDLVGVIPNSRNTQQKIGDHNQLSATMLMNDLSAIRTGFRFKQ